MKTTCPYCGVGCGLDAEVRDGRLVGVRGDEEHPVNRGATCRKPTRLPDAVHAPDRATTPLRRDGLDERWRPASWRAIVNEIATRLRTFRPEELAFYISGQLLTEDYYAVTKLAKGFLGTNNLDSNSRLCMSSAVAGYTGAFGSDGPPPSYADIDQADCILLVGSNAAACHPIVWNRIRGSGAFLIVADPRRTPTAEQADLHLPVHPGTDLPLLNAMLHVLDREDRLDRVFLARHTEGADQALQIAAQWPPERAAEVCGVPAADIVAAARRFAATRRSMALWSMGVNQSTVGTLKNRAILNLCLATGNIGRPGAGPLSLTGQPNAMGGREVGGLAGLLPGYRRVTDAQHRADVRRYWDIPPDAPGIASEPGVAASELVEALEERRVKAVWIVATNPAVSQPDAGRFAAALRRADLVIVQDAYHPTETGALAHVLLPAAQWPEKDGTMTNSERRVSLVRKALDPPGEALPDWEIFARVGRALGHHEAFAWRTAAQVHAEYVGLTAGRLCDQTAISHARLRREGPLQWGGERLYGSRRFATPTGRARLIATPHAPPADAVDDDFPLMLTTGRVAQQWHTMTRTGKSRALLDSEPEPFVELHPEDAARAGVGDGERVHVRSRRGSARLRARLTDAVPEGTAFAPFHWGALHLEPGAAALNAVTARAVDPTSLQPELKACAVRVEPVRAAKIVRRPRRRLVVVGAGMAGTAAVEALLAHAEPGAWAVTMVGRETEAPYNRVLLSKALARGVDDERLALKPPDWFARHGVTLRLGSGARRIDIRARELELEDGTLLPYDDLVLATGSAPWLPPIAGLELPHVHAFRSLADMRAIRAAAASVSRAVVIGGGLLGLEAARGLRELGVDVTVVHLADRLMELQLDALAARLLERRIRGLGIDVLCDRRTEAITRDAVELADGASVPAELVVLATGIRPEVGLARDAGLEINRGVLVDDQLRASAPGVWAVGECAEHRGTVYGLWAPVLEQARAAGAALAGHPRAFHGAVPATTLKVAGVDLFCAGRAAEPDPRAEEVIALDSRRDRYRKLVLRDGRLAGATLLGDLGDARTLRTLVATGEAVPEALLESGPAAPAAESDALVCSCQVVSRAEIRAAIADRGLTTVDAVAEHTGAGTGCGGCRPDVGALLQTALAEGRPQPPLPVRSR